MVKVMKPSSIELMVSIIELPLVTLMIPLERVSLHWRGLRNTKK